MQLQKMLPKPECHNHMEKINYVIVNDIPIDGEIMYWNSIIGWTPDFDKAHTYDVEILSYPLPTGHGGIMSLTLEGEPINHFFPLTSKY